MIFDAPRANHRGVASNTEQPPPNTSSTARFEALLATHRRLVLKVASTYARDPEDRKDLVQEILVQTWKAFPGYDPGRSFSTWLYRIALNVAISHRRAAITLMRHVSALADVDYDALPDQTPEPDERLRQLYQVIGQLDDLNKALLLLYLEGYGYRESAEVLGISETNVATKLNRIRIWLREQCKTAQDEKGKEWNSKT